MRVYLDNAATTPVAQEVTEAMIEVLRHDFGNPSSTHAHGRNAKALIETARRNVAQHLNCHPSEILFTSGGTEADNLACHIAIHELGVKRIITTSIEHHAVGHTVEMLHETCQIDLVYLTLNAKGQINMEELHGYLKDQIPTLVCLMHANNEIGTLHPIYEVSQLCKQYGSFFLTDTVQTVGHFPFDLQVSPLDFMTCAAHKLHGPKGIGFLYVNKRIKCKALILGGSQERGQRGGTENVAGIVGLSKAMDLAYQHLPEHKAHIQGLKTQMIEGLKQHFKHIEFHGDISEEGSLYTVLNVSFPEIDKSGMLLFTLDLKGVSASGGSACTAGAQQGSHVLSGIGAPKTRPNVRFSFSRYTSKEEVDFALDQIKSIFTLTLA